MEVYAGSVIKSVEGDFVVISADGIKPTETMPLEEFISRTVAIFHKGEFKTLREVIRFYCRDYLSKAEIFSLK